MYGDIASREIGVNGHRTNGQTDGQRKNIMLSTYDCWRRHKKTSAEMFRALKSSGTL